MNEAVVKLAKKLGVAADKIWEIAVRQAHYEVWLNLVWAGFWVLVTLALFWAAKKAMGLAKEDRYGAWDMPAVMAGLTGLVTAAVSVYAVQEAIICATNPEFKALEWILDRLAALN